ncbi:conserved hypothetical protein [Vibrio nigripulchritudo SO65]|uniref:hypothetical protein n=1 Tax=Vibrio nigripulchritudo TaxID=28173 RepID=UPI0003B186A7|nr:hypothetical protein [Vibrio nigripulchritudo]CCN38209.1 conserved hypothetical protein [Vibrio nigripulchritudo AM115]CCN42687.1 conserved hypothetical protein [Vibrio nigripulchritudo FTn2]CCN79083.1 conserved hypothetical protein [Vibrio nigripulchritudo SO65]
MKRRDVKDSHERSVLDSFERYLSSKNSTLTVVERPDPPDAIVDIDDIRTWVEITDAFTNGEVARSITSAAAEDVPNWTCEETKILNPDESFESVLSNVIAKKLGNQQLQSMSSSSGAGILLIGIYSVFHDDSDLTRLSNVARDALTGSSMFSEVYLYSWGHKFHKV